MNCVFCYQPVAPWVTDKSHRKPALQNRYLLTFFCSQLRIQQPSISSLEKVPNCDECYSVYNELQNTYIQLEELKVQIDKHVKELKQRVILTRSLETLEEASLTEDEIEIKRFRKEIATSSDAKNSLSKVLESCSGLSESTDFLKNETQNIKLEPFDFEIGVHDANQIDEFEIIPEAQLLTPKPEKSDNKTKAESTPKTINAIKRNKQTSSTVENSKQKFTKGKKPLGRPSKSNKSSALKSRKQINSSDDDNKEDSHNSENDNDGKNPDNDQSWTHGGRKSNKIPCPICKKFFSKSCQLRRHHLIVHEKQRPFTCAICNKGFARRHVYTMHLIQVHETEDKPYSCSVCAKKYTLQILLDRHEEFHQFDDSKPLACEHCDIRFGENDKEGLERHIQLTHTKRPNAFHCEQCNISFQNRNLQLRHDNQVHRDKFIYECVQCDKRYSIKTFLTTHMKTHSDKGQYQCSVCKMEVLTAELLGEHLLSHTGEKRLKCEDCEERFFSMGELKRHRVHEHGAEKPYECKFCQKRFILNSDRTAHIREVHEGFPNQFTCPLTSCGKGFANLKYLKNHIKKIHELSKVVICDICGKKLADTSSLKDHMNSHMMVKPYVCTYCGQRFVKKNTLKCHILTHTGEKPFACHICQRGYTQSHCLKTHLKSHANESNRNSNKVQPIAAANDAASSNINNSNIKTNVCATSVSTFTLQNNTPVLNLPVTVNTHQSNTLPLNAVHNSGHQIVAAQNDRIQNSHNPNVTFTTVEQMFQNL